jgi:hypothetical protein
MLRRMKIPSLLISLFLTAHQQGIKAQDDTAHHRAVYTEINEKQASLRQVKATHKDEPLVFELTGYYDGQTLRKILVNTPGEDGDGSEEYYIENGLPLFVFSHYKSGGVDAGKAAKLVENRFYFKDGKMFKWLDTDKKTIGAKSPDFTQEAERLTSNYKDFLIAFKGKGADAKPKAAQVATGIFTGLEEGDYTHWLMKTEGGKELSLFILKPDASVEKVLKSPKAYKGKKCRVQWKSSTEKIPEAGGDMKVDQILSVEWLK